MIGYQFTKKTHGSNPSKSIEVYMLNSLNSLFNLIYKGRSPSKLSRSKENFAGRKFKLVCHGLSLWGGVGVVFSLNLVHFGLNKTSVEVNFRPH